MQFSQATKLYLQCVPIIIIMIIMSSFHVLPIFAVTLYFLSCFLNSAVPPVQKQRIIWSKIKLRIILLNRSRGGGCFALEICVTKPLWHLGIRRCYKILCKQSNLVWVYCFLNDFSLFGFNYLAWAAITKTH